LLHYLPIATTRVPPPNILGRPLAMAMVLVAPTGELALQIHGEFQKMLSRQAKIKTTFVVVSVVNLFNNRGTRGVATRSSSCGTSGNTSCLGRMKECIEMAYYLVLNQYVDVTLYWMEADRMIDLGFAPF
jgi:superfamily II DNA/RNA helicase